MKHVYRIQSLANPSQKYTGLTDDLEARLAKHNEGGSPHTSQYHPWRLVASIGFDNDQKAMSFERYLKSGSGRAFAAKHLW